MARVMGIGGVFFKADDPDHIVEWYREHLGLGATEDGRMTTAEGYRGVSCHWRDFSDPAHVGFTVWGPFAADTTYFEPSARPWMVNLIVDDLDGMLARLREAGLDVDDRVEEWPNGRFGWVLDPEGTRIELWEPARGVEG